MDSKFFRTAYKRNRAIEITDNEAIIPAVKDLAEIRVPLPNRRPLTFEERQVILDENKTKIADLEEQIETERKTLLELVKVFKDGGSTADVVVQNLKIRGLMEERSALARPEVWIEELKGLTLKDVFESKRDVRKVADGASVFQLKRRVEPISSLYVDLAKAASDAAVKAESKEAEVAQAALEAQAAKKTAQTAKAIKATEAPKPLTAAEGAIIGQKKSIKVKNPSGLA